MKKSLYFAFLLLTLLAVTDAKAQNYSSEYIILNDLWERAQKSNSSIYVEVYDNDTSSVYDEWKDFCKYYNIPLPDIVDGNKYAVPLSNPSSNNSDTAGSANNGGLMGYRINEDGSVTEWRQMSPENWDLDGGWLDEVECEGNTRYCPLCKRWIQVKNWKFHDCRKNLDEDVMIQTQDANIINNGFNTIIDYQNSDKTKLHNPENTHNDSPNVGYHRCPCMISPTKKSLLDELKNHPLYNHDNGYPGLTKDLERQLAFPEIVQQGKNGTCGSAIIQKWLAENFPEKYADCVYNLANYGRYEPWGLWLDYDKNPSGMTQEEINRESGDDNIYGVLEERGALYTSVDAIMQSAIQTWANNNEFFERWWHFWGFGTSGYDPREDNGFGGGMIYDEVKDFMEDIVGESYLINNNDNGFDSKCITYDKLEEWIQTNTNDDYDSYTVFASVDMVQEKSGKYFGSGKLNHLLEITGTQSGNIYFWSYGGNYSTSKKFCTIGNLLILKNTQYGKIERAYKKTHVCHCTLCNGTNCNDCICMQR